MASQYYLPVREADRLTWLQNFALKLNVYVGTAGIFAAQPHRGGMSLARPVG